MKKVALVGLGPGCDAHIDPEFEVWTCNFGHLKVPRFNMVFELHNWKDLSDKRFYKPDTYEKHMRFLRQEEIPIVMQHTYPQVPMAIKYPLDQALALTDGHKRFRSSFDWMVAYAILDNYEEVQIHGFVMDYFETEYRYQRPSALYWIGKMEGAGISVSDYSLLDERPLYGFEDQYMIPRHLVELRKKQLEKQNQEFILKMAEWKGIYVDRLSNGKDEKEAYTNYHRFELSAAQTEGAIIALTDLLESFDKGEGSDNS